MTPHLLLLLLPFMGDGSIPPPKKPKVECSVSAISRMSPTNVTIAIKLKGEEHPDFYCLDKDVEYFELHSTSSNDCPPWEEHTPSDYETRYSWTRKFRHNGELHLTMRLSQGETLRAFCEGTVTLFDPLLGGQ